MTLYPAPKPSPRPPKAPKRLQRATGVRKRNAKRAAKNHARAYGAKRDWIVRQPCAVCGWMGPSEPAHAKTGGTGRKSDARLLIPMCGTVFFPEPSEGCHQEAHRGVKTFEKKYGVNLLELAAEYEALWQAHLAGVSGGQEERDA